MLSPILWAVCVLSAGSVIQIVYRLSSHPLAKIPGPKLWASFRLPYVISLWRGKLVYDVFDMHEKYGDVVRVAPNEVSFASGKAWEDIHCRRPGHKSFPKNPVWWGEVPERAESIVSASTIENHERQKKAISHCFTDQALKDEESLIQFYVNKLIEKLRERCIMASSGSRSTPIAKVNMVDWYMFTTFDIMGDLCFGSTFGCLEHNRYHPWILEIFTYFKFGALFSTLRFYDWLAKLVVKLLPAKAVEAQERNYQWAVEKVRKRLDMETQRDDFMKLLMPHVNTHEKEGSLTTSELENNFYVLTVAGSHTCGTVLSGTTSYLVQTPGVIIKMRSELHANFANTDEMSFQKLAELPYLNAVVNEGLRLAGPIGGVLSHIVPPGGDTVCGIFLPGGTHVGVHHWSLYRSASRFTRPASFIPERWLPDAYNDPESPYFHDDRDCVQAFSIGSWQCLGKQLGLAELRLILARMVWHFDMVPGGKLVDWDNLKMYVAVQVEDVEVELAVRNRSPYQSMF